MSTLTSKREAPKRKVVDYWKQGEYGSVGWFVKLECEHVEVRKRKPPKDRMACLQCAGGQAPALPDGVVFDPVVQMQSAEARTRRLLADRLGVSEDAVTVLFGGSLDSTDVTGARVYLDAEEIRSLLRQ